METSIPNIYNSKEFQTIRPSFYYISAQLAFYFLPRTQLGRFVDFQTDNFVLVLSIAVFIMVDGRSNFYKTKENTLFFRMKGILLISHST